ncbi:MAG: sugar ABC transporter permease [Lachnospiraceae bacterium]|nr:sugar ABC transporter permease [Lachnospiraceae bacterium]
MATRRKKRISEFESPYTVANAFKNGNFFTRLGMVLMGSGNFAGKQIVKGFLFLAIEVSYLMFMINSGFDHLYHLVLLGGNEQQEIWNEAKGVYEYTAGDNSLLFLLYGVTTIFITIGFICFWRTAVKSGYKAQCLKKQGKHVNSFVDDLRSLRDGNLHNALLSLPVMGIVCFTILPLIFMICMAFTDYSKQGDHLVLFHWVGFKNFAKVLDMGGSIGQTFGSVLVWTIVWAILATFLNYILGMILAIVINRKTTRIKGFWRFCFILSAAIPQFVSLLLMRTLLQPNGLINALLQNAEIITGPLPFLSSATWARIVVVVVNLWIGIPFTMMQVTGILQNIPGELYEAAKMDGAGPVVTFFKITLPYMLFVTTPYLITTFTGNINNFNVIYLLTGGAPTPVGSTAGKTDLLVTWLYKLTIDEQYYNLGAVIGIMTFIVLAIVSLITYRNSGSYKNEEGFQ